MTIRVLTIHNPPNPGDEDFCNAIEGEISVAAPTVCDTVYWCGCDRSHPGLNTLAHSTTLMVRDNRTDLRGPRHRVHWGRSTLGPKRTPSGDDLETRRLSHAAKAAGA